MSHPARDPLLANLEPQPLVYPAGVTSAGSEDELSCIRVYQKDIGIVINKNIN